MIAPWRSALLVGVGLLFLGTSSCSSCSRSRDKDLPPLVDDALLPQPPTPSLPEVNQGVARNQTALALPSSCSRSDKIELFEVKARSPSLRVLAPPGAGAEFAVGQQPPADLGPALVRGIVTPSPELSVRDLPWSDLANPPLYAHDGKGWVFAFAAPATGSNFHIVVARDGRPFEKAASGDAVAVVDLACDGGVCAILSTRVATVRSPGATVLLGDASEPAGAWGRYDIGSPGVDETPVAIAGLRGAERTLWAVMGSPKTTSFVSVGPGVSKRLTAWPAQFGVLAATRLGGDALLIEHAAEVNERGCAPSGALLSIRKGDHKPHTLGVTAPPWRMHVVPLSRGALVVWIAPVNCLSPQRPIVYALVLGEQGEPVGGVMPVGDATDFAVRPSGDAVELFLVTDEGVERLRFSCSVP